MPGKAGAAEPDQVRVGGALIVSVDFANGMFTQALFIVISCLSFCP